MTRNKSDNPDDDEAVVAGLRASLDRLDRAATEAVPSGLELERLLFEHRKTLRHRLARDLALFLCVAVALITGLLSLYASEPALLVIVQTAAVTVVPCILLLMRRKRVSE